MKPSQLSYIIFASTLALSSVSVNSQAQEYKFVATDNSMSTKMCIDAATNNKRALKHKMSQAGKQHSINYRTFTRIVKCNDQHIALFALTYGADNTFNFLNSHSKDKIDVNVGITDITKVDKQQPIKVFSSVK